MKLHWYGHSNFLLTNDTGKTLLIDPFNERVGYPVPAYEADVVLTTHGHYDHANTDGVKPGFKLFNEVGEFEEAGFRITGIQSYHDEQGGALRGSNIIFVVEADGERICHMGDIGHVLPEDTVKAIGAVDVLLQPVGGNFTVNGEKAKTICSQIAPKTVVPMHFKTEECTLNIEPLDVFLDAIKGEKIAKVGNDVRVKDFPSDAKIALMSYGL